MRTALLMLLLLGCPVTGKEDFPPAFACGDDLLCNADNAACVIDQRPADCFTLTDTAASCPEGTEPDPERGEEPVYCCEPTPEPTFRCVLASKCGDEAPSCACADDYCADLCEDVEPQGSRTIACSYGDEE